MNRKDYKSKVIDELSKKTNKQLEEWQKSNEFCPVNMFGWTVEFEGCNEDGDGCEDCDEILEEYIEAGEF